MIVILRNNEYFTKEKRYLAFKSTSDAAIYAKKKKMTDFEIQEVDFYMGE